MRPLIQYDLDEPPAAPPAGPLPAPHPNPRRPPTKKRKRHHHNAQRPPPQRTPLQHWDDPGSAAVGMVYDEPEGGAATSTHVPVAAASYADEEEGDYDYDHGEEDEGADVEQEEEEEEEDSRALTHAEIWDDAALVDAWHSAEAEYEAYHGTSKAWKTEPVKKSPLWYNKPYTPPAPRPGKLKARSSHVPPSAQADGEPEPEPEPDTAPIDFNTFVPTHDPSLAVPSADTGAAPFFVPPPSTTTVSRDEAFSNALNAMYWGGYWTAVYHCQSQSSGKNDSGPAEATEEDGIEADEDEDEDDLVPAQR